jgi:hypothetical protein
VLTKAIGLAAVVGEVPVLAWRVSEHLADWLHSALQFQAAW